MNVQNSGSYECAGAIRHVFTAGGVAYRMHPHRSPPAKYPEGYLIMPTEKRTYTEFTTESILLLGQMIKLARKQRGMSEAELSMQASVTRTTLNKIERGDLDIGVGLFFEAATLVGLKLFDTDDKERLQDHRHRILEKITRTSERSG